MTTVVNILMGSAGRCPIRSDVGHRCNKGIGHEGKHSAFGHEFTARGVVIAKVTS